MTSEWNPAPMWNERYSQTGYAYGREPNAFLKEQAQLLHPGRALCLADGQGRNGVYLASLGFQVTSIDISPVGIDGARRLAQERGVELEAICADLAEHDIGTSCWDLVVSIYAHMPRELRSALHRRVATALAPGGYFLLEAYTPANIGRGTGGPQSKVLCMTADELRGELATLQIEYLCQTERDVTEGVHHSGVSAVVQMRAVQQQ